MPTLRDTVEQFLASLRSRRVPTNTIKSYAHDLRHFAQAMPADLGEVTASATQAFLDGDGHHSQATQGRRYATLCSFYQWAIRQELVAENPMNRLEPIVQPKREPCPLDPEEVNKILKAIPAPNLRDRALFTCFTSRGLYSYGNCPTATENPM